MKKIVFITGIVALWTGLFALSCNAAQTKILINVVEEGGGSGDAMIKSSEIMIARELINKGFDVMTSDDLSGGDLRAARSGSAPGLRKAAANHGAAYILSAKARTRISEEDVLNMKMNKAATSFSYKIINAASGKTVDMDSLTVSGASRSPEAAAQTSFQKLSADISGRIAQKVPRQLSASESSKLASYKTSLKPKPAPKPKPKPQPQPQPAAQQPAMTVAQASPEAAKAQPAAPAPETAQESVPATPEKPKEGPEIVILNPPPTRGFMPVSKKKELTIEGLAVDPTGISEVRINGEKVNHDKEGRFMLPVTLSPGENRFLVMAVNTKGRMVSKEVGINQDQDTAPPEIVLLQPSVTRGFQVMIKPESKKTVIEGMVKDESNLLFVRINSENVPIGENGHFLHELPVSDATTDIAIEAADVNGNVASKSLSLARGDKAWAASPQNPPSAAAGPAVKPVLWGLAIGVSKYSSTAINLKYADQDAIALEKFFNAQAGKSFSEVHFKSLTNDQVSRDTIIESITQHLGMAAPEDVIFLFVAGHGIKHRQSGSYYFMPADADFDTVLSKGLRMSDFEESIKILSQNVNKIIVAMDTCHSGALEVGMRGGGESEDLAAAMNAASGLYILSASKAGEVSMESPEFKLNSNSGGHGAFTFTLVEAMQGKADYDKDSNVSLNEMFQFVSRQVPRLTNGQQHPYFRMQGTDLPLVSLQ
ncbi:MAG: caspase family protein [Desulfosalsimonadaceae bacterium]